MAANRDHARRYLRQIRRSLHTLSLAPRKLATAYRQRAALGASAPGRREIIDVDPREIGGHLRSAVAKRLRHLTGYEAAVVVGGDWDREIARLNVREIEAYESCRQRWVEGRPWHETSLYASYVDLIRRGVPCDYNSVAAMVASYERLDAVFERVRREGRLSDDFDHLIKVNVDRDGGLSWGPNGRHRLVIALLCGFETIPARVGFVHPQGLDHFQTLRRRNRS